ncbi:MAG: ATP-dependent sacrificial sulfur transferase LarE [Angustibacter sp.]
MNPPSAPFAPPPAEPELQARLDELATLLRGLGSVLVAFSAGADSAFLLAAAVRALGTDRVGAATGVSGALATGELTQAREFAAGLGVRLVEPQTRELDRPGYASNPQNRCYHCKSELLDVLTPLAASLGLACVVTGTNADDARDPFRPGIRAAAERGAQTPLRDAGFTKDQVRAASRLWNLPTWDKPAAACLSSRVAYGVAITPAALARVDRAERAVRAWCRARSIPLTDLRVRDLGQDRARLELAGPTLAATTAHRAELGHLLREQGFTTAEVDERPFRSGVLNIEAMSARSAAPA